MALTVPGYVNAMQQRELLIGDKMGVNLRFAPVEARVTNIAVLAMIGCLMRVLSTKLLITDAELAAAFDQALTEAWPVVPVEPPGPTP